MAAEQVVGGQDRGEVATTPADSVRFRAVSAPGLAVSTS